MQAFRNYTNVKQTGGRTEHIAVRTVPVSYADALKSFDRFYRIKKCFINAQ